MDKTEKKKSGTRPKYMDFSDKKMDLDQSLVFKNLDQLEFFQALGRGGFGLVRKCAFKDSEQTKVEDGSQKLELAIKFQSKYQICKQSLQKKKERVLGYYVINSIWNEISLMSQVQNPFLLKMHGVSQDKQFISILTEYMAGGDLNTTLFKFKTLSLDTARFYLAQVILGLEYLHNNDIIFRDLKPENILLGLDGYIKIADFGFAKRMKMTKYNRTFTQCGTIEYMAPETISQSGYMHSVDWWAVGILLYEMLVGYSPFKSIANCQEEAMENIMQNDIIRPANFDDQAYDLIQNLCQKDPEDRLSDPNQIKKHPFFQQIDWEALKNREIQYDCMPYVPDSNSPIKTEENQNEERFQIKKYSELIEQNDRSANPCINNNMDPFLNWF